MSHHPPTRPAGRARLLPRRLALLLALASTLFFGVVATQPASAAPKGKPSISVPVEGETSTGLPVTGTYKITRFATKGGELVAKGTFVGEVGELGDVSRVKKAVTIPVSGAATEGEVGAAQVSCDILNLVLGPLDLNLLGLRVQLNQVELDITAEPGSGNLLGNLLCAVAGLLDGPPALNTIVAALLNYILGIIG